ncbi:response regulator [Falsibacillus albus]|uniref:Response regulator n=1 Tax=Falsibacillus albus TaxID=2478915 RepID=A0A3L7JVX2_9BACI|nr:response regulator [Falsibacillus albus]RLQ93811.1 response regulator [Falsibacillus albus]
MINILIAEDDFRVASVHEKFLLTLSGINIIGKTMNAKETREFLEEHSVDLLILDVYLPDELGTDLLPYIRAKHPEVDIIMITASTDKDFLVDAIRHGIVNYLIKPVSLEKFTEVMVNYKKKRLLLDSHDQLDQSIIDNFFGNPPNQKESHIALPKGIDQLTLEKVDSIINHIEGGISAEDMGKEMGVSRTTARRYLEYLISIGKCKAELAYGIVGRPERHYYPLQAPLKK